MNSEGQGEEGITDSLAVIQKTGMQKKYKEPGSHSQQLLSSIDSEHRGEVQARM